eukprot:Trichotokara_eunicae@DN5946_c0_g1_i7.p1
MTSPLRIVRHYSDNEYSFNIDFCTKGRNDINGDINLAVILVLREFYTVLLKDALEQYGPEFAPFRLDRMFKITLKNNTSKIDGKTFDDITQHLHAIITSTSRISKSDFEKAVLDGQRLIDEIVSDPSRTAGFNSVAASFNWNATAETVKAVIKDMDHGELYQKNMEPKDGELHATGPKTKLSKGDML